MGIDEIDKKLDIYVENVKKEREKTAQINKILFLILIVVVIIFILTLWRYHSVH